MAKKNITANYTSWTGTSKKDTVQIKADNVSVNTGAGNDSIENKYPYARNSTINAGAGSDTITFDTARYSSINAGAGNDEINLTGGSYLTIKGGSGNDTVHALSTNYNLHQYALGDGNDVIYNWGAGDTLSITGGTYTKKTSGSDVILTVGSGKISLVGAKGKDFTIKGTLAGGSSGKTINNTKNKKKLTGTSYADKITNSGLNVTINAGKGNDSITNTGSRVSINSGEGNDWIFNEIVGYYATGSYDTIDTGAGNDTLSNDGANALIHMGTGNDSVLNYGANSTVNAGDGNDKIINQSNDYDYGSKVSIVGGAGNDTIWNNGCEKLTISGGTGNDSIINTGTKNIYKYANGDGKDVIFGFGEDDTIKITGAKYTKKTSGNDVILTVGKGKITLKDVKGKTLNIDGTLAGGSSGKVSIPSNALKYNGHSYYIYSGVANTWNEAKAYCEALGGHLAVINNAKENTKLFNYMKSKGYDSAYFGLSDAAKEGTWTWVNGDKVSYKNWANGEPNNGNGGNEENYGQFSWRYNYTWNDSDFLDDINDNVPLAFICEWDTVSGSSSTVESTPIVPSDNDIKGTSGHDNLLNGNRLSYFSRGNYKTGINIFGYAGNDTITNRGNNVYINGGAGNDSIQSRDNTSNVTVLGGSGNDKITVSGSDALIYGDDGNDKIWAYNEGNFIYGGNGADYIRTENNNNGSVDGGAGNDTITAYSGTHLTLSGGAGNDSLWGGVNSDTLIGGTGDDTFVYKPGEGTDHITDFSGGDMLKILKTNGKEGGTFTSATFSGGNLTLAISGGGSVVLDNVSSGQSININGTNYKISGKTLK